MSRLEHKHQRYRLGHKMGCSAHSRVLSLKPSTFSIFTDGSQYVLELVLGELAGVHHHSPELDQSQGQGVRTDPGHGADPGQVDLHQSTSAARVEHWSHLIGSAQSRYCALIGGHITMLTPSSMPYQHTSGQVKCRLILALSAYLCCYGMIGGSVKALGQNTSSATSESDSGTTAVQCFTLTWRRRPWRREVSWPGPRSD